MSDAIAAEIKTALQDAGIEVTSDAINKVAHRMKNHSCSAEDAVMGILEAAEAARNAQAQRVQYDGKTPEGYQRKMAHMSMQQLYELANTGVPELADQVSQVRAEILAMTIRQDDATGKTFHKAAALLGDNAQAEAFVEMMGAIQQFKSDSVGELPAGNDFFTKRLQSSFKPLAALGSGK